jgi:hypothetical protein
MTFSSKQSYTDAVDALGERLAAMCGSFRDGTSALGHPKRSLLKEASGGAKRQLSFLKVLGHSVVAVPFYELAAARGVLKQQQLGSNSCCSTPQPGRQHEGGNSWCLRYVSELVKEHCSLRS